MKIKKILSIILMFSIISMSLLSVFQISAQTEEGASIQVAQVSASEDGSVQTASRPAEPTKEFMISNENNFAEFMTNPELWGSNVKVNLACDIDMKGKGFKPIKEFSGVFDGCGHTVSNFSVKDSFIKLKNSEFAFINILNEFAEIKNVTFDNYTIQDNAIVKVKSYKAAELVVTNHGVISNVDIINGMINNIFKNGKVAGFVFNNEEDGIIKNCFVGMSTKDSNINAGFVGTNFGKVINSKAELQVNSEDLSGGFVSENAGIIEKCRFKGDVKSKKCAGGFCGNNLGEISSCKSECNVKVSAKKVATICGGFIGSNSGIVKNCSSIGAIDGQEYAGGFVGVNNAKGEISSSESKCDVKSHTSIVSVRCGGFVGVDEGKIENCAAKGKVSGCVDAEKVLEIGVGTIVGVAVLITAVCLLTKKVSNYIQTKNNIEDMQLPIANESKKAVEITNTAVEDAISNREPSPILNNQYLFDKDNKAYMAAYNMAKDDMAKDTPYINRTEINNAVKQIYIDDSNNKFYKNTFGPAYDACYNGWLSNKRCDPQFTVVFNALKNVANVMAAKLRNNFIIALIAVPIIAGSISLIMLQVIGEVVDYAYVGAFCGYNLGEIIKCSAQSDEIEAKTLSNDHNMCGGFVGTNGKTGIIKDSNITGIIKDSDIDHIEIQNKKYTGGFLGGFVGENIGKIENGTTKVSATNGERTGGFCGNNSGEISTSQSEGDAKANATTVETKCGGFVGNNDKTGKISNCTSTGSAIGQEYVGGFCGDNSGDILKSKSEGNAKADAKTLTNKTKCGGFVGNNDEQGKINSCISKGSATGQEYVGGFAGVNKSEIIDCNAHGKAIAKTKANTAIAGGFVGENEKGTIIGCKAIGGADSRSSSGQAKSGGFVGVNKAIIMDSKASGYVYLSAGTCHKDDGCGGFAGKNDQGGIIDGCYAKATMQTKNKKKGGGFVGEAKNKSTIKNCNCKTKIVLRSGTKNNITFCENKDKKAVIQN